MSAVLWNLNGQGDAKLLLHDTLEYLATFDIIVLVETLSETPLPLRDYTCFYLPAPQQGLRGYGSAIYVRDGLSGGISVWKQCSELSTLWLRCPGALFGLSQPVYMAACYLPPQGSQRLQRVSIQQRVADLSQQVAEAQRLGVVMLCGDFNAVAPAHLVGATHKSLHSALFEQLCASSGLQCFTGVVSGDTVFVPSFAARAHTAATRPDHVVGSPDVRRVLQSVWVNTSRLDSDHYPLEMTFHSSCVGASGFVDTAHVRSVPHVIWDSSLPYSSVLHDRKNQQPFTDIQQSLGEGHVAFAADRLMDMLQGAARVAGMRRAQTRLSKRTGMVVQHLRKPWFDDECRHLKQCVQQLRDAHAAADQLASARATFNRAIRRKKRAWGLQRLDTLVQQLKRSPHSFWQAFKAPAERLPANLRTPDAWTDSMRKALNPDPAPASGVGIMAGSPAPADGTALLAPITCGEVSAALGKLQNHKSAGLSGGPTELFRYAMAGVTTEDLACDVPALLAEILNGAFDRGEVPQSWNTVLVSPIFKRGDRTDTANYRPISVGDTYSKLYATVLNARLMAWLEEHGLRAPGQSGFRPHLGTSHQIFALQHFVQDSKRLRRPLYVCFVDFSKAYDRVPRHLLWQVMSSIGVPTKFVQAIQSMYNDLQCMVRVGGLVGPAFPSVIGVKQGCPLSPTLFGIFIDRLYFHLRHNAPGSGYVLGDGSLIPLLQYADDFLLVTHSPWDMKRMLRVVDDFMQVSGMLANVGPGKTEMIIFGLPCSQRHAEHNQRFCIGGHEIAIVSEYKYLGVVFHESKGCMTDVSLRRSRMQQATGGLRRMLARAGVPHSIALGLHLYDVVVRPVATYASAAWVPSLHGASHVTGNQLEKAHLDFLRVWCRLRPFTPSWALYRELGRLPIHFHCWSGLFTFWNQVVTAPNAGLWQRILRDAYSVGRWGDGVHRFLDRIHFQVTVDTPVDMAVFRDAILRTYDSVWEGLSGLPREAEDNVRLTTYYRWFDRGSWSRRPPYLHFGMSAQSLIAFMRFKLASHDLLIETGRWRDRIPRQSRICRRCHMHELDDERHLVFDCPVFEDLRRSYRQLFSARVGLSMPAFFAQPDQYSVVHFVLDCLHHIDSHCA